MKTIIVLISLLFSLPAAGYEVIFHQGFEGEQFPPAGWEALGVYQDEDGYNSYYSAVIYRHMDKGHEGYSFQSPEINISGIYYYTFRYYTKSSIAGPLDEIYAGLFFDSGDIFYFDGCSGGYDDWEKVETTLSPPENATTVYFRFYFSPNDQTDWFPVNWWIDEVSVVKTATAVTPTSLGDIKAAYR